MLKQSLMNISGEYVQFVQQSKLRSNLTMVKKLINQTTSKQLYAIQQQLRRASITLQRHILQKNQVKIKGFLQEKLNNHTISFEFYDKYMDIIRQTKKEIQVRAEKPKEISESQDSDEERMKIHKEVSLPNKIQVMLENSRPSYEVVANIFRKEPLAQRLYNQIGNKQNQQQRPNPQELSQTEELALKKIKFLYRKYQVSNMFKNTLSSKIRKDYVQRLIHKGYLRQKRQIITLIC